MKKAIYTIAILLLSASGFSQSSFLYESSPYGSRVTAKSDYNPVTGYTSYSVMNNLGIWEQKGVSVPNTLDKGASTLYSYDNFGISSISSFSSSNLGGGLTIYSKDKVGGFSPSDIISPNYSGTLSIYSRSEMGNFVPSGYYNPASGQGYIKSSSIEMPTIYSGNSIYSNSISLPSLPSLPTFKF
jgi:hypothetical protein